MRDSSGVRLSSSYDSTQDKSSTEALAGKQEDADSQSDADFLLFKECHYGQPTVRSAHASPFPEAVSPDPDSPQSPFEVLGDGGRDSGFGRDVEDTADRTPAWQLPSSPGGKSQDRVREVAGRGIHDAFMDSAGRPSEPVDRAGRSVEPASVGDASEFHPGFSPSVYMWDKLEPPGSAVRGTSEPDPWVSPIPSEPTSAYISQISELTSSQVEYGSWISDQEPADLDSSGESDDTVIEDTPERFRASSSPVPESTVPSEPRAGAPEEPKEQPAPAASTVHTVKQSLREEDEDDYEIFKGAGKEVLGQNSQLPKARFDMEPSPSPKPDQTAFCASVATFSEEIAQISPLSKDPREAQSKTYSFASNDENVKHPSYSLSSSLTEKWNPDLMQDTFPAAVCGQYFAEECSPSEKNSGSLFNQGLTAHSAESALPDWHRASGESRPKNPGTDSENRPEDAEISLPKPVGGQPSPRDIPRDPFSHLQSEPHRVTQNPAGMGSDREVSAAGASPARGAVLSPGEPGPTPTAAKQGHQPAEDSPETSSDPESIELECSVSAATDSFVDFMRECLNSRPHKEPEDFSQRSAPKEKPPQVAAPFSGSPPAMLLDLEQEHLTICALKELGSSQEEEGDQMSSTEPSQTAALPETALQTGTKAQTSITPAAPPPPPPPPPPCNEPPLQASPVRQVERTDAPQLAEHVLSALLTHLSVRDLVLWRDPRKTGVVFGVSLLVLLSLATFSVISVVSYLLLALLCVTITFRVYKSVIQAVQKSNEGHPFKALMEKDVTIPTETFRKHTDIALAHLNRSIRQLRRLFLVEDLVDSLKLAIVMWLLTYVGAIFNGITLLILADILVFSSPLVYEKYKTQIDRYVAMVRNQIDTTLAKLQEKLPGAVKRSKAD
ncbi:cell surface glycoprotein 1-like isoform X1 [Megalops cyprinoides]|uniref:cell surface glycoprotein 1-like isoform X1 n=1 Tax=Megalops cyprinoides TaxID=118141 RepID=UPI001864B39D|nr:cell surface glycoprotein 1-like isoform X1 [Megalops cyprinoides]